MESSQSNLYAFNKTEHTHTHTFKQVFEVVRSTQNLHASQKCPHFTSKTFFFGVLSLQNKL